MVLGKKGAITDMIIFIVVAFVVVAFFGLWAYGFNTVTNVLTSVEINNVNGLDFPERVNQTFGEIDRAQRSWLPIVAMFMILGMGLFIFISNYVVRVHPLFIVPYIMVIIVSIVGSVYISNAYEEHLLNGIASSIFTEWTVVNYLLVHLPYVTAVVGVFGLVFLFINNRSEDIGGGIV